MTPRKAVFLGHALVNVPVLLIVGSGILGGYLMMPSRGTAALPIGIVVGIAAAWLWWFWKSPEQGMRLIGTVWTGRCKPQKRNGSSGRTRTYNPPVNSRMLCH